MTIVIRDRINAHVKFSIVLTDDSVVLATVPFWSTDDLREICKLYDIGLFTRLFSSNHAFMDVKADVKHIEMDGIVFNVSTPQYDTIKMDFDNASSITTFKRGAGH